jgi:hypothetical protein
LNPPSDNDDVAKVTPLRRRDGQLVAVRTVRDPLPAETSVWDTDEPGEPRLRPTSRRRVRSALAIGWTAVRDRVRVPPRFALGGGVALACLAALVAFALGLAGKPVTRPHHTVASTLVSDPSSSANLSSAVAPSAHRLARSAHRATGYRAIHRAGGTIPHRLTRVGARAAVRKKGAAHRPDSGQSAQSTAARLTPPSSTPASTPTSSTVTPTNNTSSASDASRSAGPSGTGAAFGPGY